MRDTVKRLTAALAQASDADKPACRTASIWRSRRWNSSRTRSRRRTSDLLQAGGNVHQRIQMMQQEHDAAERNAAAAAAAPAASPLARLQGHGRVRCAQWLALRDKQRWLGGAQRARQRRAPPSSRRSARRSPPSSRRARRASRSSPPAHGTAPAAARHARRRGRRLQRPPQPAAGRSQRARAARRPGGDPQTARRHPRQPRPRRPRRRRPLAAPTTLLELTRQIAAEQHRLTLRDQRITARHQLADIYGQWESRGRRAGAPSTARAACRRDDRAGSPAAAVVLRTAGSSGCWRAPVIDRRQLADPAQRGRRRAADRRRGA